MKKQIPAAKAARERAEKLVIALYEKYIAQYASEHRLSRECLGTWALEAGLIDAIEKGVVIKYGEDVAFGMAIVISQGSASAMAMEIGWHQPPPDFFEKQIAEAIAGAAKWLQTAFYSELGPFRMPLHTARTYKKILTELEKGFFDLPITNPLV